MRNTPDYPLRSVDNALRLIVLLRERGSVRLAEVADALETSRSTAHRLLAMLEYHGFARQDAETRLYEPGPGVVDLRALARPSLERLCEEVGETVHLVGLRDASVVFLDSVETSHGLRVGSRVGVAMPAHCTAGGKALLAQLTREELERLHAGRKLERMTSRSLTSPSKLRAELELVRRRGYATNSGESENGVAAVAVAIPGRPGDRRAAITVSAPADRLSERRVPEIARAATRAAADALQD
jgi:IclR family transcriptional regulator, acetate operon repressor